MTKESLWSVDSPTIPGESEAVELASRVLASMSIEQKIAQMIQAELAAIEPQEAIEYQIGSILNGGGSFPKSKRDPKASWLELADRFASSEAGFIPILWGTDAVHGHNNLFGSPLYPHNIGLGASRNFELIAQIAHATALEVLSTGIDWTFAPTLAVPRDLRWGRTYEGFSEDPGLVKQFARAMFKGLQGLPNQGDFLSEGRILATAKHFVGEGCTFEGIDQGDSRCSESDLVSIHAQGHLAALESGAQVVMAAFNSWNGEKIHGSKYLLTDVLKGHLNFQGFIVSDWDGFTQLDEDLGRACELSVNAGVDMLMVSGDWRAVHAHLTDSHRHGRVTTQRIDDAVFRILRVKALNGMWWRGLPSTRAKLLAHIEKTNREKDNLARTAVRESLVLLKNEGCLPLDPRMNILVAGEFADSIPDQCGGWSLTWQGTENSNEDFPSGQSIYEGFAEQCRVAGGRAFLTEHLEDTSKIDAILYVFGETPYAEGDGDLQHISYQHINPKAINELRELRKFQVPVVGMLVTGRPLWINPELNATDAFVVAWLPGTQGGAVAEVILTFADGTVQHDFRGKLPQSWPKYPTQYILNCGDLGYDPLFPLGFGLTYANKAIETVTFNETDPTPMHPKRERSAAVATAGYNRHST